MQHPERGARKHSKKKKAVKICLSEPEEKEDVEEEEGCQGEVADKRAQPEVTELGGQETAAPPLRSGHLEDLVCQLAELDMVYVNEKDSERHLLFLSLLLRSFSTPRVFGVSSPQSFERVTGLNQYSPSCRYPNVCRQQIGRAHV